MNRRGFLGTLFGGVAASAAVRTWPFRVYSFPSTPKIYTIAEFTDIYIKPAMSQWSSEAFPAKYGVMGFYYGFDWHDDIKLDSPIVERPSPIDVAGHWPALQPRFAPQLGLIESAGRVLAPA